MKEPLIHSHIEDGLPNDHLLAWEGVSCVVCGVLLHAGNNECMQTWVETGRGAYCLKDFILAAPNPEVLDDQFGLPE